MEEILLDILNVLFYRRKINRFDGPLGHNIDLNPKKLFNFICHCDKIQPHRPTKLNCYVNVTIFRSFTTRIRTKYPQSGNGVFPLKLRLVSAEFFQYGV